MCLRRFHWGRHRFNESIQMPIPSTSARRYYRVAAVKLVRFSARSARLPPARLRRSTAILLIEQLIHYCLAVAEIGTLEAIQRVL